MNPANSLKEGEKIGHIKINSYANFVGFKKNPLENIRVLLEKPLVINRGVILK
jgi:imidazolonepropionase-like amidohydrolase